MKDESRIPLGAFGNEEGQVESAFHNPDGTIPFESLPNLVGRRVSFRDPAVRQNSLKDPYFKVGTLREERGRIVLVVDGPRPIIINLLSQKDLDRYQVKVG